MMTLITDFTSAGSFNFDADKLEIVSNNLRLKEDGAVFPTDPQSAEMNSAPFAQSISGFTFLTTIPVGTEIRGIIAGKFYDSVSSAWIESDGTFSQASALDVIETNISTLISGNTKTRLTLKLFLYSEDDSITPEVEMVSFFYTPAAFDADEVHRCKVFFDLVEVDPTLKAKKIIARLNVGATRYKNITLVKRAADIFFTLDENYRAEALLVDNENMTPICGADAVYYDIYMDINSILRKVMTINVPETDEENIFNIMIEA